MSLVAVTIGWAYVPGSLATKVEYKKASDSSWTQPSFPTNPTNNNYYTISIQEDTIYDVRLTTIGPCAPKSSTIQFIRPSNIHCCPSGYTLSTDGTYCQQTNTVAATPPSSPENAIAVSYHEYSCWGTVIYDPGFNVNGTGSFTQIPYTNGFWVNGSGYPSTAGSTAIGPMNRAGLWSTTDFSNQVLGYTVCITIPTGGIYYVGVGADDMGSIKVDGNTILQMDVAAMDNYMAANGYPLAVYPSGGVPFRFWHIYPVALTAGTHVLEVIATDLLPPGAFAAEIYNASKADLLAATSYADLGAKLIFSTKDKIGQPLQVGNGGLGYTCPSGYSLVLCDGPAYCKQVITTPLIDC